MMLAASETEKMLPAKTATFPHSTGRRRGTAVSDARIIPVPYSPPVSSTPSTPKATTAKMTPVRLVVTGLKAALSAALNVWYWLAVTPEQRAEADHQHDGAQQSPHGRPQRAELRELREQHPALGHPQRGHPGRGRCRGGGGQDRAHRAATASAAAEERKSTQSSVSRMKASSSEACRVVSS